MLAQPLLRLDMFYTADLLSASCKTQEALPFGRPLTGETLSSISALSILLPHWKRFFFRSFKV